jgi:hypothetical protein
MSSATMQSSATDVDGYVTRGGVIQTWANIIAGNGTAAVYTPGTGFSMKIQGGLSAGEWTDVVRGVFMFDPAGVLPTGAIITGASISLYPNATTSRNFLSSFVLTSAPVTAATSLIAGDYQLIKATQVEYGTARVTLASLVAGTRFTFTLNAAAFAAFQAALTAVGVFKLGLMFDWDFDNTSPTWASAADDITVMTVESGSTKWPILTITYRVGMGYATVALTGTKASAGDTLTADMWAVEVFT